MNVDTADSNQPTDSPPLARARDFSVRHETLERIRAGHRVILDELKPTRAQIDRGLELHYNSFVADVQGSVQMSSTHGISGDRLRKTLNHFAKNFPSKTWTPMSSGAAWTQSISNGRPSNRLSISSGSRSRKRSTKSPGCTWAPQMSPVPKRIPLRRPWTA